MLGGAPSPDGQWLVTASQRIGDSGLDIVLVRADSGETRRLTNDITFEDSFSWAPDGSKLYFRVAQEGSAEIWSIRTDGSGREKVFGGAPEGEIGNALASPDGRTIYVQAGAARAPYLLDTSMAPSKRRLISLPPLAEDLTFKGDAWSPDGSELLGRGWTSSGTHDATLWLFSLERKTYSKLAKLSSMAEMAECCWFHGSRQIVLFEDGYVWIVDRETGAIRRTGSIGDEIVNVSMSSDGRSLYGNKFFLEYDIWMLDYGAAK